MLKKDLKPKKELLRSLQQIVECKKDKLTNLGKNVNDINYFGELKWNFNNFKFGLYSGKTAGIF
jgi:hypothetical protein